VLRPADDVVPIILFDFKDGVRTAYVQCISPFYGVLNDLAKGALNANSGAHEVAWREQPKPGARPPRKLKREHFARDPLLRAEGDRPRPYRRLAAHGSGGRSGFDGRGKRELHAASASGSVFSIRGTHALPVHKKYVRRRQELHPCRPGRAEALPKDA
jgi:hypothetical protein